MPWKILGRCLRLGCSEMTIKTSSYCEVHTAEALRREADRKEAEHKERVRTDPEYAERSRFYKSPTWKRLRRMQLAEEPLCRSCGLAARVVDHIVQISQGGERYDMGNLQSLCSSCHDKKRQQESRRTFGKSSKGKG
jgi:5-methylcytosine-specific restriction protein A